jgi:hypothetical protein
MKPPANRTGTTPSKHVNQPGAEAGSVGIDSLPGMDIEATETITQTISIKAIPSNQTNNPGSEGGSVG